MFFLEKYNNLAVHVTRKKREYNSLASEIEIFFVFFNACLLNHTDTVWNESWDTQSYSV